MAIATKTRKRTEIQAATINRGTLKSTGATYYAVKSDSSEDYHYITWNAEAHRWECSCKCGSETDHAVICKHIRAVNDYLKARYQLGAEKQKELTKAESDAYWSKVDASRREAAPLNGNRAFALMR